MEEILELSITNYDQQWRMDTHSNANQIQHLVYQNNHETTPSGSNSIYSDIEKNHERENTAL